MGCNHSAEKRITPQPDPDPVHKEEEVQQEKPIHNDQTDNEPKSNSAGSAEDTYEIVEPPPNFAQQPKGISETKSFFSSKEKPTIFEYKFKEHIGHGAQSDVFLTVNIETGQYYAAKVYDQNYLFR